MRILAGLTAAAFLCLASPVSAQQIEGIPNFKNCKDNSLDRAMTDGYSTYHGLGLGLPGARRLMDEFEVATERGRGTTITMTKWRREG